jgi:hypothetical protein
MYTAQRGITRRSEPSALHAPVSAERISVKSRFLPFPKSLARYGSLWHASARRPLLEQEDARSCFLRDPAIPDAQSGFRLRSSINESTRGKPGGSRQSNIGRACEHCVMLTNASIQKTACRFSSLSSTSRLTSPPRCPNGWMPAFAGMTRVGLEHRDAAVVPRRRLSVRAAQDNLKARPAC